MKTLNAILLAAFLLPAIADAQVIADFEDGNIDQWLVEADGVPSLSGAGNPGNCLRVNDQAVGEINEVVAPWAYTGDWSAAQQSDSISFDLFAHELSGNPLAPYELPLITLSGPGGTARILIDTIPPFDVWHHIAVPLDSSAWIVTGSWTALMAEVQVLKIRTEFIQGDEWTLLDNVRIPVTPAIEPIVGAVCSTWDSSGVYDGWSFQNVGSIQVDTTHSDNGGCVRLGDGSGITYAVAAPKFRGDWSDLDGEASMTFDLYLQTSSSNYYAKEYLVKISGPGGSAKFMTNDTITALNVNQWLSYEIPIDENSWELMSGSWTGLMDFVSEIRLELEFINTTGEVCFLDNFCLNAPDNTTVENGVKEDRPLMYPNPFSNTLSMQSAVDGPHDLRIVDMTGRTVFAKRMMSGMSIDLSSLSNGAYTAFFWKELERIHRVTLIKQ